LARHQRPAQDGNALIVGVTGHRPHRLVPAELDELRQQASAAIAALRAHAAATLARHEVPARWWLHPGPLPTNPSGKVLRREVRAAWTSAPTPDAEDQP